LSDSDHLPEIFERSALPGEVGERWRFATTSLYPAPESIEDFTDFSP
jgi:hypothetical protein